MRRVYNRYIPDDTEYIPAVSPEKGAQPRPERAGGAVQHTVQRQSGSNGPGGMGLSSLFAGKEGVLSLLSQRGGGKGLTSALKTLKLGDWDSGDLLLLLIVLLLLTEGDDLELVIALGLALMMGLGEEKENRGSEPEKRGERQTAAP